MTPAELTAYGTALSVATAALIKGGEWLFSKTAAERKERRAGLEDLIARQEAEIARLRAEVREQEQVAEARVARLETRLNDAEARVRQAERDRAQMEGLLYRMGWEKTDGGWRRNGDPK